MDPRFQLFFADRAAYQDRESATIICNAGYLFQSSYIATPEVTWLKDGVPVLYTPSNSLVSNKDLTTTLNFPFSESDAGVYQCVYTDTIRPELLAIYPIQIDFGE